MPVHAAGFLAAVHSDCLCGAAWAIRLVHAQESACVGGRVCACMPVQACMHARHRIGCCVVLQQSLTHSAVCDICERAARAGPNPRRYRPRPVPRTCRA